MPPFYSRRHFLRQILGAGTLAAFGMGISFIVAPPAVLIAMPPTIVVVVVAVLVATAPDESVGAAFGFSK